ncbi:hypothetical protein JD844_033026 [Phrynosoma platyrhinos]|uniref:F5/8 type C domain-containing protein n=1 Tax=Phrynosoma platyrhinos TaxID=52577 RepID=A0ABQ7T607_PHRPL|nr:hypothetical protein JD844_033026 [Phrynosoma platyrhinos]
MCVIKTSPKQRVDDGVPPGQTYKYIWEVTAKTGPREADPPCLTYTYYSHINMVQDFNSGLIGVLLICKEGSLKEDGTQKQFDKEYVLLFAVFDESKSWNRATSLMYTINGYANGTLPEVQACTYDRISWHLIGMSSGPEIFSVHFNGQTLEQNQYKVSAVNLVGAGMHGYLNIEDCGNPDTLTKKLSYKELRFIKDWDYFIAAEEIVWDYAPEIPDNIDRQYKDATFSKRTDNVWFKERGILGPVIRAQVRDKIKVCSVENITQGKAVQPGETYTYKWTVLDTDEPTAKDAQCVTRIYHSAVDMTRDIASGLIGPLLICKRKALDQKGIQNKADVEQHAVFAVFDENKSWYLEDNIKEYCSNPSTVKRDDPKFYKSNVMHTLNGYAADRRHILGFCQSETVEWHLISVGTQDEIVPVHLSGHTFLSRGRDQDILNLFPMSGESTTVTMDNVGTWLLSSWGSREMNSGMRLRFRDAKCDDDDDYISETEDYFENEDDVDANVVSFPLEKSEPTKQEKEKENRGAVVDEDEDEEQLKLAALLGLRTFKGSVAEKEELNLTALAMQEDADSMASMDGGGGRSGDDEDDVSGNSHLVFTDSSDHLHGDEDDDGDVSGNSHLVFTDNSDHLHGGGGGGSDNDEDEDDVSGNSHLVFTDSSDHLHGDEDDDGDVSGNSHLVFTGSSDHLHGDKLQETKTSTSYSTSLESFHPTDTSLARRIPFSDFRVERNTLPFEQGQANHEKNAIQIPGSYSPTIEPEHLRTAEGVQEKDGAELLVSTNTPFSEKEEEENVSGRDTSEGKGAKPILTEATLFALKEMQALLFHVKQKRNLSSLENTTLDIAFLTTPTTVNMSSSYKVETDNLSHDFDKAAEDANTEPPMVPTNLTLAVEESLENHTSKPQHASSELKFLKKKRNLSALNLTTLNSQFIAIPVNASSLHKIEMDNLSHDYDEDEEAANTESPIFPTDLILAVGESEEITVSERHHASSEPKFSEVQNYGNLTLDNVLGHLVSTLIPKTVKSEKMENTWNVISEKQSYDVQAALAKEVDNKLQNSSRNATEYPEKMTFINKKNKEAYKANSLLELGQAEIGNKHEVLGEERSENFTINASGTFVKIRRKKKNASILTPRTSKPLVTPGGLNNTQTSITANYTSLLNGTNYTRTQKQSKPIVTIGLPVENGDYQEYIIDNIDDEESSSGSFEYQMVHYDNPYTTDSRLDSSIARNPDDIAGRYLRALNKGGNLRRYYIAAEEIFWDYTAEQKSTVRSGQTKTVYRKAIFKSYQDDTFKIPSIGGEYEEHLGILGPVIRAEVDDVIQVQFKNLATRSYSLHAHGLYYEKSSEGRSYDDHSPEWFKTDDAIRPNETYTYVWHANKRSGPAEDQRVCKSWAYYSAVNPEKDIHSGLIGPILICQKGMLDEYNRPKDMREFVLSFMVFDEEKSWYFDKYGRRTQAERPSGVKQRHVFPGINGVSYQLQGLRMYTGEEVHWHLLNMGAPKDIHVIHFHGQTFREQGMEDHQLGVYPLLPGTFTTVEMTPSKAGKWLLETEVGEYQEAGMQALFAIIDKGCKLPMGLASGFIQDLQISASGHTGYWEPKLARLYNSGKYNAWSTEKKKNEHPWIQLFEGNSDAHGIKENHLDPPIVARYVRIYPNKFYNRPTLRMELLGCETEDCSMPLGMENGAIENAQITASSYKKTWWSSWEPSLARLNLKGRTNAWQAKSNNNQQWLQIDLLQPKKITGIITQGARSITTEMYVKTFSILYSNDDSTWKSYVDDSTSTAKVFAGNVNSAGQVKHYFEPPIFSRFIRVVPKTWNQSIALRIELFGCDDF